jgi:hypothetical protein
VKPRQQTTLLTIVWLFPLLALPLYFFAILDAGLSAATPNASFGELLLLGIGPLISLLAFSAICCFGKITVWRTVAMLIPALLSVAELIFTFLLGRSG